MRILVLNYEYPPLGGGAANATAHLLKEYAKLPDIEVDLVTSGIGPARIEKPWPNITIHFLDIGKTHGLHYQTNRDLLAYTLKSLSYARQLRSKKQYHLCHAFFGIPCGYIARRLRLPYIVSLRGSDVPFYNPRFKWPDRLVFQRMSRKIWVHAAAVVANSDGLRRLALETAPNQKIDVIPNGVDTDTFFPAKTPRPDGSLKVLCVARLIPRKGIDYLIEAFATLPDASAQLTLVGKGNHEDDLKNLVDALGLNKRVAFLGEVRHEDLPAIYRDHDVFVLPSLNEGMSNTVLEAMASGLPLILTDTGGTRELMEDGVNGRVIAMRSADAIADALRAYTLQPEMLRLHGHASRCRAESMSWASVATAYRKIYDTMSSTEFDAYCERTVGSMQGHVQRYESSWRLSSSPRGDADATMQFLRMAHFSPPQGLVVEFGSGSGHFLNHLETEYSIRAVGSDIAMRAVQNARTQSAGSEFLVFDASRLPLKSNSVDACFSFDVIEHLPDVKSHFQEVFRVLKPGAMYYLQTPNWLTNPLAEILKHGRKGLRWREYHLSLQSSRSLRAVSLDTGFSNVCFYKLSPVTPHKLNRLPRVLRVLFVSIPWKRLPRFCQTNLWLAVRKPESECFSDGVKMRAYATMNERDESDDIQPAVSVVMPVYNDAPYLEAAIQSILAQTLPDFELIIVDDGSTDSSREILERFLSMDHRIRLLEHAQKLGRAAARNKGIFAARAPLICFQDADDTSPPDRLRLHSQYLEDHPEVAVVFSHRIITDESGRLVAKDHIKYSEDRLARALRYGCVASHTSAMFRTHQLQEIGGYRTGFPMCEDYDMVLRYIERGQIGLLDNVYVYVYRKVPSSISVAQKKNARIFMNYARLFAHQRKEIGHDTYEERLHNGLLAELSETSSTVASPAQYSFLLARQALRCDEYRSCLGNVIRGIRHNPFKLYLLPIFVMLILAHILLKQTGLLRLTERLYQKYVPW